MVTVVVVNPSLEVGRTGGATPTTVVETRTVLVFSDGQKFDPDDTGQARSVGQQPPPTDESQLL